MEIVGDNISEIWITGKLLLEHMSEINNLNAIFQQFSQNQQTPHGK